MKKKVKLTCKRDLDMAQKQTWRELKTDIFTSISRADPHGSADIFLHGLKKQKAFKKNAKKHERYPEFKAIYEDNISTLKDFKPGKVMRWLEENTGERWAKTSVERWVNRIRKK